MKYYSTHKKAPEVSLQEAVVKGLAPDNGLYMPKKIKKLPYRFFEAMGKKSFIEIAETVATAFFGEDIPSKTLNNIVSDVLNFEIPLKRMEENVYVLELFHGPTFAFKDIGARFMARLLAYFVHIENQDTVNVLVATSGDTGSAVANGFFGVEGIRVFVLYPKGKVSAMQEAQFTTLGQNIVALEVDGTFDDCQALVKEAFLDKALNEKIRLTSANSINVARFLPQSFYYFYAWAQLKKQNLAKEVVISVPSGNFGNLTAGLFAQRMGLPVKRFIAANNRNDVFFHYIQSGKYTPRASVQTLANAMDVGAPSNFARILDLYHHSCEAIKNNISAYRYSDDAIRQIIRCTYKKTGYILDPHGACAYQALKDGKSDNETGVFLATAHPAKFIETVSECIGSQPKIPEKMAGFMQGKKQLISIENSFEALKSNLFAHH